MACRDASSGPCFDAAGACESAFGVLRQCYEAAVPGGTCDLRKLANRKSCVPDVCKAEGERVETCIQTCDAVTALCG